jgi:2-polyprenyl-3-methyl-5-hydroxy-6-metoxy-1,4-benzoquinol methylase
MAGSAPFIESSIYSAFGPRNAHAYLLTRLMFLCSELPPHSRVLDVGCGNGFVALEIAKRGHGVVGIDLAERGVQLARENCPTGRFEVLPADKDILLALHEEPFDLVYSLEVIEHVYDPRSFMGGCYAATRTHGRFLCTTPYHGYLKNVMISVSGKWDHHHNRHCDGGHIQFFSRKTLSDLMLETGFRDLRFEGAGRLPHLWKSMVMEGTKPDPGLNRAA